MAAAQILCCNPQPGPRNPSRVVWKRACVVDGRTAQGSILLEHNQCHDCGGGIQSHPSSTIEVDGRTNFAKLRAKVGPLQAVGTIYSTP